MATTALVLDGWDEQSIIGTDEMTGGWFAQLWQNGSDPERPDVWVNAGASPSHLGNGRRRPSALMAASAVPGKPTARLKADGQAAVAVAEVLFSALRPTLASIARGRAAIP